MEQIAGWVAPVTTTIAACMTAANLGPRFTGWGFVVFSVGAIAWALVGFATGQGNLLWQNGILLLIDVIGIWRWLGREARYDAGARAAARHSEEAPRPTLFPASRLVGCPVRDPSGAIIATTVDAMAERGSGRVSFLVVREGGLGGVGERLHAIPWARVRPGDEGFASDLDSAGLTALPTIDPDDWLSPAPAQ